MPDQRWGETVKAVVVAAPGAEVDPAQLIAHARRSLAAFTCPTSVDVVEGLACNASSKVLRRELYWVGHERRISAEQPAVRRRRTPVTRVRCSDP